MTKREVRRRDETETSTNGMVLLITGMHRSGTSLVASLLEKSGLDLGESLLPADRGNPRGYFEDVDFYDFHRQVLASRRQHITVAEDFVFEPTDEERQRAEDLLSKRRRGTLWGWKDPGTTLFLDFWNERLPDARFLFLFRHPLEVLLSLARRSDVNYLGLSEGIDAWTEYNRRLLAFFRDHHERSALCHIRAVVKGPRRFATVLRRRLGLEIDTHPLADLYHPEELRQTDLSADLADAFASIHPSAMKLYGLLNESADLDWTEKPKRTTKHKGFATWVQKMDATASPGLRRGLTSALLGLVEPDSLDALYRAFTAYEEERDRGERWLRSQLEAFESQLRRSVEANAELRGWAEELSRGRDWLSKQKRDLEAEAKRSHETNEELQRWASELERGRDWLVGQREDLQAELSRRCEADEELRSWAEELERGRDWLLSQREILEAELSRRTEQNERLQSWAAELERGRDWLLSQRENLEREISRRADQNEELRAWAEELERGRDWLQEQRHRLEACLNETTAELRDTRTRCEELRERLEGVQKSRDAQRSEIEGLRSEVSRLIEELASSRARLLEVEEKASALTGDVERLSKELHDITTSRWWRIRLAGRRLGAKIFPFARPGPEGR